MSKAETNRGTIDPEMDDGRPACSLRSHANRSRESAGSGVWNIQVQVVLPRFMPGNDEWEYGDVVVEGRNVYVNGANKKEYKKTVSVIGYEQAA